ncbi:hypothetical protein L3V59_21050 [Burkholderia aenigmatica]|uniref:hypothetical protein n=1 Tax=Burkholderia aenigmatica TaxID=2015348 RepID=UPI001F482B13|nr:hypothetical protein [Burkholderia aenigmatica]UKD15438.1 hypothetical protein L3V59_21050 [Burkholderia aenigmatica]
MSQQIHAKIKRTSKYYGQTQPGKLFPVQISPLHRDEYVVNGNNNFYRLRDVNLFIVGEDGYELRIA